MSKNSLRRKPQFRCKQEINGIYDQKNVYKKEFVVNVSLLFCVEITTHVPYQQYFSLPGGCISSFAFELMVWIHHSTRRKSIRAWARALNADNFGFRKERYLCVVIQTPWYKGITKKKEAFLAFASSSIRINLTFFSLDAKCLGPSGIRKNEKKKRDSYRILTASAKRPSCQNSRFPFEILTRHQVSNK